MNIQNHAGVSAKSRHARHRDHYPPFSVQPLLFPVNPTPAANRPDMPEMPTFRGNPIPGQRRPSQQQTPKSTPSTGSAPSAGNYDPFNHPSSKASTPSHYHKYDSRDVRTAPNHSAKSVAPTPSSFPRAPTSARGATSTPVRGSTLSGLPRNVVSPLSRRPSC